MPAKLPSLRVGERFGRWVIIAGEVVRGGSSGSPSYYHLCRCDCGAEREVQASRLRSGAAFSCGCYASELRSERNRTHGLSQSPLYTTWCSMIARCENPNVMAFRNYGGRGIKVCERWRSSFELFVQDMGPRPEGTEVDRIDNDGDYEPSNCRWTTRKAQTNNMRKNRHLTAFGKTRTVSEWADELGVRPSTLHRRLKLGWPAERVLGTPVVRGAKHARIWQQN